MGCWLDEKKMHGGRERMGSFSFFDSLKYYNLDNGPDSSKKKIDSIKVFNNSSKERSAKRTCGYRIVSTGKLSE